MISLYFTEAVRLHAQFSQVTDAEFALSISKWLAQAPLRAQREMYVYIFTHTHFISLNYIITL